MKNASSHELPLAALDPSHRGAWWVGFGLVGLWVKGFCDFRNGLAGFGELVQDLLIGKTNHSDSKLLEESGAFSISSHAFWGVVLRAIKFNHQFARGTVKIHNKILNGSLAQPSLRLQPQKVIPKPAFRPGHLNPKLSRSSSQLLIVNQPWHPIILPFPRLAPLCEGSSERE